MLDEEKRKEIFSMMKKETEKPENQESPDESRGLVKQIHEQAVIEKVKSDEEYQKKFFAAAALTIDFELESLHQEQVKRRQQTTYDANREACENYGIHQDVPLWQINMMKAGSGFWFIIYFIFASVTIAPINIFFRGINSVIKNIYVAFMFSVLGYLIIAVGIPLLITLTSG